MGARKGTAVPEAVVAAQLARVKAGAGLDKAMGALVLVADMDADAGVGESPRGSNRGPLIAKFFAADQYEPAGADEGYAWCAAAVSYWVQTWLKGCPEAKRLFSKVQPPRTAGAFALQTWAERQAGAMEILPGALFRSGTASVRPGDVLVYAFSHCGIAKTASKGGFFTAIEGNTDAAGSREGWQVARKVRGVSSLRAALRFVPKGIPA